MIARFIQRFLQEENSWEQYADVFAGLPENY